MRVFISFLFLGVFCFAQAKGTDYQLLKTDSTRLPKVFVLGEHEKAYEKLFDAHSTVLLEVCNDNMDTAFDNWLGMLKEMETYANTIDYDLKGIKVWLNIFWNEDGSIKHIAYHLKVNSRNIRNTEELTAFFSSFMNHYNFPISSDRKFSHYGSASFPVFAKKLKPSRGMDSVNSKKTKNSTKDSVGSKY